MCIDFTEFFVRRVSNAKLFRYQVFCQAGIFLILGIEVILEPISFACYFLIIEV